MVFTLGRQLPPSASRTPTASPACAWRARSAKALLKARAGPLCVPGLGLYCTLGSSSGTGCRLGLGRCLGLGSWRSNCLGCCLGAVLGAALGAAFCAALHGRCLGCCLGRCGRRLGLCGKSHPLGTEGGVRFIRRLRGQVGDHFFALRQGLGLVFAARGPASWPWRRLRLLHRFFNRKYFLKDLRGLRRDPKTARRTTTSPAVGRLGLRGLSAGSTGVSG